MKTLPVLPFEIIADTREQRIPPFPQGVTVIREKLDEGDYSTPSLKGIAAIERKSLADLVNSLTWERARFDREVERLQRYQFRAIVAECNLADIVECRYRTNANPASLVGSILSLHARHGLPTIFAGNAQNCGRAIVGLLRRLEDRTQVIASRTVSA